MVDWGYFHKYDDIVDMYVSNYGEGDNQASQAVTAVLKLVYKYYNDGDVYDNTYHLEGWANDLSSYANWLYKYMDMLPTSTTLAITSTMLMIKDCKTESDYEDLLKRIADLILGDESMLKELSELPKVGSIYDCSGPFRYEKKFDDGDDYYDEW